MYSSKIKEEFRGNKFTDEEYKVLFDIGEEKVMIFIQEKNLIYDIYKNKLETPDNKITFQDFDKEYKLILCAKKDEYEKAYNLTGKYKINYVVSKKSRNKNSTNSGYYNKVTNLNVVELGGGEDRFVFPSRFKVYSLTNKVTGEHLGGEHDE